MEPATYLNSFHIQFRHGSRTPPTEAFTQTGSAQSRPSGAAESKGSSTTVLDDCGDESDAFSDAGTCHLCELSEGLEEGEEDAAVAELFGADAVRKKMEVLATMVGMGGERNDEPGAVLGEVVRALRELQRKAEVVGWRSSGGHRKQ